MQQTNRLWTFDATRFRDIPMNDGKGPFREYPGGDNGIRVLSRSYDEHGLSFVETVKGNNRFRIRAGGGKALEEEARAQGESGIGEPPPATQPQRQRHQTAATADGSRGHDVP